MTSAISPAQIEKPRLLIFGFSNVASGAGFSIPLQKMLAETHSEFEVIRAGLGALQLHVVPPFLRAALEANKPISHVLLEVTSSAFSSHPLATEELGRELLLDAISTVLEFGAQPILLLHYRNRHGKQTLDLEALAQKLCDEAGIAVIDLSHALVAEMGQEGVHQLLKDDAHTTPEGSDLFAERAHQVLCTQLDAVRLPTRLARPQWRRRGIPIADLLPENVYKEIECFGLTLPFVELQPDERAAIRLDRPHRVIGLSFLYHAGGGHIDLNCDEDSDAQVMITIDPFSYVERLGVHAFRHYVGRDLSAIEIGELRDAPDVKLLNDHKRKPMRTLLGPLLVMEPSQPG